ncbi:2-hydroxymuconate tautomerase [Zavarzinia sp.]|uniref:2-hydroxymuconate tautomerase n=1 Tax=Zavarzinia sp. TaxID=2027920 RepID=UPI003561BE4E
MPIVEVTLIEGRSFEAKKRMVEEVTSAITSSLGAPREAVRVIIREVPPWHFATGGVPKGEPPEKP